MAAPGEAASAAVAAPSQPEVAAGLAASAVVLPERLQRREAERQQGVERQRQKKEAQVVKEEQSEFFLAAFAREREAVEALLAAGTLEEAAARLQALQKLLTGSVRFLAPYEVRQGQETVARLQGDLAARRQQLQPKKKFAFHQIPNFSYFCGSPVADKSTLYLMGSAGRYCCEVVGEKKVNLKEEFVTAQCSRPRCILGYDTMMSQFLLVRVKSVSWL
uniref:Uncharacterized protein n=1 Tax=Corvus moneduloides TaxID=1196302 RepID=A0A8C3GUC7_CORMO